MNLTARAALDYSVRGHLNGKCEFNARVMNKISLIDRQNLPFPHMIICRVRPNN